MGCITDVAAFASTLEPHVEPLSEAIAGFLEERDLIECAGDLAQAVTAINRSLEHLEQSTENRAKFAAAIDRLDAAIGTKAGLFTENRQSTAKPSQQRLDGLMEVPVGAAERQSVSDSQPSGQIRAVLEPRERYQQMWQQYSRGMQANNLAKLDYLVGRKAFEDGQSHKAVSLMLTAGSPYVAQLHREQGKEKARTYVNQTTKAVCRWEQKQQLIRETQKEKQLEL